MKITLIIIGIILIFIWHRYYNKKIDKEEMEASTKPAEATFLRNNFGEFITSILDDPNNYIVSEHSDRIIFGKKQNNKKKLVLNNYRDWNGAIMHVVIHNEQTILFEMKFPRGTNATEISNKVLPLFS